MPELPEVQTVVTTLHPRVVARRITGVRLVRPDIVSPPAINLPRLLKGRTITELSRRGKRIVFTLDDTNRFYIHLGMTGQLTAAKPDAPEKNHTHLVLTIEPGVEVRFRDPRRFGGVFWLGKDSADAKMGPEPLTMSTEDLAAALKRTTRAIKNALMDQQVVAGLGNIYVDESLHHAGIHPLARADRLKREQVERLVASIQSILTRAIEARGSTLRDYVDSTGLPGSAQLLHAVYDRKGEACRTCSQPIRRIVLGGRSTHFCANCQPRRSK